MRTQPRFRRLGKKSSRLNLKRMLGLEQLEDRRLLVTGTSSITTPGTYPGGHVFAITTPASLTSVINIPAGATEFSLTFSANVTNTLFPFPPVGHGVFTLEVSGAKQANFPIVGTLTANSIAFNQAIPILPGVQTLEFKVKRSVGNPAEATIATAKIVAVVNRIPSAATTQLSTDEDKDVVSRAVGNDDDNDPLIFSLVSGPSKGQLVGGFATNGDFRYRPNPDVSGSDSFVFKVTDDANQTATGTVSISITPVNDPPSFSGSLNVKTNQGASFNIDGTQGVMDPEGNSITKSSILFPTLPQFGSVLSLPDGTIVYTPNMTFQGVDSFAYTIADSLGARSNSRTVSIGVVSRPVITQLVDDVLPVSASLSLPGSSPIFINDLQPTFRGTGEPGATIQLSLQPSVFAVPLTAIVSANKTWEITLPTPLPTMTRLYSVTVTSTSTGVPAVVSDAISFTLDATSPSVKPQPSFGLRKIPLTEDVVFEFVEGVTPDAVTGFDLQDLSLNVSGGQTNLLNSTNASVVNTTSSKSSLRMQSTVTSRTGTYKLALNANGSLIADLAGNLLTNGINSSFAVDSTGPRLRSVKLDTVKIGGNSLPVPVVAKTSASGALVSYTLSLLDQQFIGFENAVTVSLVEKVGSTTKTLATLPPIKIPSGNSDKLDFTLPATITATLAPGQHELSIRLTDAVGNPIASLSGDPSSSFSVFVSEVGTTTASSPGTPADSTMYFLGAKLLKSIEKDSNTSTIFVNQEIRVGATIRLLDETVATNKPESVIVTARSAAVVDGKNGFMLTIDNQKNLATPAPAKKEPTLTQKFSKETTTISWLRSWTMTFDKTTQTIWFTNEDGHYLGQFDPATGDVKLYDVTLPNSVGGASSYDPHGVAFDFNTHATPRVWFAYRNGLDTFSPGGTEELARIGYLDLVTKELVTFDLSSILVESENHTTHTSSKEPIKGTHAVVVDARGHVWVSAEHSNALIEIDLSRSINGDPIRKLDSRQGTVIVHKLPEKFADVEKDGVVTYLDFEVHGIQVTVDQRTGEPYVYITDGNTASSGRIALLRPGSPPSTNTTINKNLRSEDQWFEWNLDKALIEEGRLRFDSSTKKATASGHPLFLALNDNETPGFPEDDLIIVTDAGAGIAKSAGVVRVLDPRALVAKLVQSDRSKVFPSGLTPISSKVDTIKISAIPGASSSSGLAAPQQAFVDRAGNIVFFDSQGSFGRLNPNDAQVKKLNIDAPISVLKGEFEISEIKMTGYPRVPITFTAERRELTGIANTADRSQQAGIDQYEVAELSHRGQGPGAFRGFINAENTIYSSLSQSDHIAVSVVAESSRRQLAVVPSPFALPTGYRVSGRAALQVLSDGSVVLTARGDGELLDKQINLTKGMLAKLTTFESGAVNGDMAAVGLANGNIEALGRSATGALVRYQFTQPPQPKPAPNAKPTPTLWKTSDLVNVANWKIITDIPLPNGQIAAEDPAPIPGFGFTITTAAGHLIVVRLNDANPATVIDLSATTGPERPSVYAGVGGVVVGDRIRFYGGNQKGQVVEYSTNLQLGDVRTQILDASDSKIRPVGQTARDVRMLRNIRPLLDGTSIRLFGTDGVSQLVHYELTIQGGTARLVKAENITQSVIGSKTAFGYFDFQKEYAGRVYTNVSAMRQTDGTLRVYGTNGSDLIEFTRSTAGQWRVGNLTNNILSTNALGIGTSRIPANFVFGAPNVYTNGLGERHVLQINADGEIIEYYTLFGDTTNRIHTQNVNLRIGASSLIPNLRNSINPLTLQARPVASTGFKAVGQSQANGEGISGLEATYDVNRDGAVTPLDVLTLINALNRNTPSSEALDVSGDQELSPIDILIVINFLNRQSRSIAEGESSRTQDSVPTADQLTYAEIRDMSLASLVFDSLYDEDEQFAM